MYYFLSSRPRSIVRPRTIVSRPRTIVRYVHQTPVLSMMAPYSLHLAGYDVSGDEAGNGCPHKAGTCLVNEEFSLGK